MNDTPTRDMSAPSGQPDDGRPTMFGHPLPGSLREWQASPLVHPYTCPNRSDGRHTETRDLGMLDVTDTNTLECPTCGYTQPAPQWAADSDDNRT